MNRFIDKVEIERNALKVINRRFGEQQLFGLSSEAIKTWYSDHPNCQTDIFYFLLKLSKAVCALSERSGERFDEAFTASITVAKEALENLKKSLG
jgi:hypothetical protein